MYMQMRENKHLNQRTYIEEATTVASSLPATELSLLSRITIYDLEGNRKPQARRIN